MMVTISGPLVVDSMGRPDQQELVLKDVVKVPLQNALEVLDGKWGQDWALGYAITVHSSQGLTIADPQKVWTIDDFLQWSNLAYLAVSRVEYMHQLERVVPQRRVLRVHTHSPSSSSARLLRRGLWPKSNRTKPRGSG
ncbi:MAG: hypothetical protein AB2556_16140 [Candidatus Thiodiazotropha sp.]